MKTSTCLTTTTSVFKSLTLPSLGAVTAYLSDKGIQISRTLDASDTKDNIKDQFSLVSSTVNVFNISNAAGDFVSTLFSNGTWNKLSCKQKFLIAAQTTLALACAGYSLYEFGTEQHTLAAGLSAATSTLLINLSNNMTTMFAKRADKAPEDNASVAQQQHLLI
ncbi:MAG: hypothetical protein SFW66_10165 [Gammaproteobacteria bacterium]|nr:hypothetical protein [Gammaproteobacteria bacterium]